MRNNFVAPAAKLSEDKPVVVSVEEEIDELPTEIHLPDIEPGRVAFIVAMIAGVVAWKGGFPLLGGDWLFFCAAFWVLGFVGALVYMAIASLPPKRGRK
jgi:hypothetical protein